MGIQDLLGEARKIEGAVGHIQLEELTDHKIAIDASGIMYSYLGASKDSVMRFMNVVDEELDDQKVIEQFLKYILNSVVKKFLYVQCLPIFVFDGEPPEEKKAVHEQRSKSKKSILKEIAKLKKKLQKKDVFQKNSSDVNQLRKLIKNCPILKVSYKEALKELLDGLGIPTIQAKGEAEKLCSMMCREGLVSAVFSSDSDCLAYGAPVMLTSLMGEDKKEFGPNVFRIIFLKRVMKGLGLKKFEYFLNYTIMMKNDYNRRISGIGPAKIIKLIKEYKTIEEIPEDVLQKFYRPSKLDKEELAAMSSQERKKKKKEPLKLRLNHERCIELFSPEPAIELCAAQEIRLNVCLQTIRENGRTVLEKYGMESILKEMIDLIKNNMPEITIWSGFHAGSTNVSGDEVVEDSDDDGDDGGDDDNDGDRASGEASAGNSEENGEEIEYD